MEADPFIGQVVADTYTIERHVADGGIGRVYCGRHVRLGHRVAIKVLSPEHSASVDSRHRFEREARIAAKLTHPHIVKVHDFDSLGDGNYFLAMEWLEGESLQSLLRRGLEPSSIADLLRQLASAIDFAHAKGVVHRDLKPDNVFIIPGVENKYYVKVLDFGIAKMAEQTQALATQTGVIKGTPAYMAPEQAEGHRGTGAAADRYAFAAIAMQMITGGLPHPLDTPTRMLVSLLTREPRLPSQLDATYKHLDDVFQKALARDPQRRFATCQEFIQQLVPLLKAAPAAPYAPTLKQSPVTSVYPRHARLLWLIGIGLVICAAIASYFFSRPMAPSSGVNAKTKVVSKLPNPSATEPTRLDASIPPAKELEPAATSPDRPTLRSRPAPRKQDGLKLPMPDEVFAP